MSETDGWDALLYWAKLVAGAADLDGEEHSYKLEAARILRTALDEIETAPEGWQKTLYKALNSKYQNMVDWRPLAAIRDDAIKFPDQVHGLVMSVARSEDLGALDTFGAELKATSNYKYSPGDIVSLCSLILLAQRPATYAPFKPSVNAKWLKLVGSTLPPADSLPSVRYGALLDFLDELIRRCTASGIKLRDRLDAQGLAWALTEWDLGDLASAGEWTADTQAAFAAWRGQSIDPGTDASPSQRAWLVRAAQGGDELTPQWFTDGFVSLAATYLDAVEPGSGREAVRRAVDRGYQHQDYAQRLALTGDYYSFLTTMDDGDIVTALYDGALHMGHVLSEPAYGEEENSRLRRDVDWSDTQIALEKLPAPLPALLDGQGAVVDLTDGIEVLQRYLGSDRASGKHSDSDSDEQPIADPAFVEVPTLPNVTDSLAGRTHMPREYLQDMVDLLQARNQFVFYGPPGTGKTFLARALAAHLVGDDQGRQQLVQFHPSYAYEDFFEGFRPDVSDTGQAVFRLTPGPLRRIARDARANPGKAHVLIIDEMNRANIAKVFGELYFLLEYRDASVNLQYSPGTPFHLPRNLFIIGTMNTADRSIALVDAAIRRRFPFVELHPDSEPVRGLLRRFLAANSKDTTRARLLDELNAAFDDADRDFHVGPSYLMRPEADTAEGLEQIWQYDILPLVTEHYYGRLTPRQVGERFGLAGLREHIARTPPVDSADSGGDADQEPAYDDIPGGTQALDDAGNSTDAEDDAGQGATP